MAWKGLLHRPRLQAGLGNWLGVKKSRPRQIRPYAAAEGTPAAETSEVNATDDGRIVHVMSEETPQTTKTAFRGWPSTTWATQGDHGRTPSRATAKTRRDAASIAIAVFFGYVLVVSRHHGLKAQILLTNHNATMQTIFMKMWPPSPRIAAYRGTNGCVPPKEKSVSASGWRRATLAIRTLQGQIGKT